MNTIIEINKGRFTIYRNEADAIAMAERLNADDAEGSYKVAANGNNGFVIQVYDDEGEFVFNL